jgi:glycosyltransferase 2 family protein
MLTALSQFDKQQLVAALLLFRLLYFIIPFTCALTALGLRELYVALVNGNLSNGKTERPLIPTAKKGIAEPDVETSRQSVKEPTEV